MTKDNHFLGTFDLKGIPPNPRGVPEIEVKFSIDADGILQVFTEDQGTGKAESITVTAETGCLSQENINRMIEETAQYDKEDKVLKDNINCRNGLESYLYNLKNNLEDNSTEGNVSAIDKKDMQDRLDGRQYRCREECVLGY